MEDNLAAGPYRATLLVMVFDILVSLFCLQEVGGVHVYQNSTIHE